MRFSNSMLWLLPTSQVYSPSNSSSEHSARLAWRVEVSRASSSIGVFLKLLQQFTIARTCCSKQESALGFTHHFHAQAQVLSGPEHIGFIRPFNDTGTGTIEILLEAEVEYLFG